MTRVPIRFAYLTGVKREILRNARLVGSWDHDGSYSDAWTTQPMDPFVADDGCPAFHSEVSLVASDLHRMRWGVVVDSPGRPNAWGIVTNANDGFSAPAGLTLGLSDPAKEQRYYLTHLRRLGANKHVLGGATGIRFAVWAPNAAAVEVVIGDQDSGYISSDGAGITETFPMWRDRHGVWKTDQEFSDSHRFSDFDHRPYMFRITNEQGRIVYRTDLYSRCQIGRGHIDPAQLPEGEAAFRQGRLALDGTVSCSVVIDAERVTELFAEPVWPETRWLSEDQFWANEFDPLHPVPTRLEDLVIYELHVAGLGAGRFGEQGDPQPGTLADAIHFLDYIAELGVNAVELLPLNEFEGWASWGYGSSHFLAVEYSGGGRDQFKHFIRECHRRGIAVILDVVYNHYHHHAERAQWAYDSDTPEHNLYYWYEGSARNYADPSGGYVDNESTGYAPRFWDENIRKLFISSAVALITEFHVDGLRVDQTTSIHSYARIHATGDRAERANRAGADFLRELTRTLKLLKPDVMLVAEDHSGWDAVTKPCDFGGLGFDAVWYADFYHHLIGDGIHGTDYAKLIVTAGLGDDRPLAMNYFAGALSASAHRKIVYHESHDEAGNAQRSGRTLAVAVNRAPLLGETRRFAEARSRLAGGLCLLSAGTPMFFMGEEVGATNDYRYDDFMYNREDFAAMRVDLGERMFRYYQDLIRLRRARPSLRSRRVEILHVDDGNRVIGFLRSDGDEETLVLASLANRPWAAGYAVNSYSLEDAAWREVFNSDASAYGGWGIGNSGGVVRSRGGTLSVVIPTAGLVVFARI
jgi:1,4-alpha-glucan branching enzyme